MAQCKDCKGTGRKDGKRQPDGSWVRCWTCNGNGLEPVYPNAK